MNIIFVDPLAALRAIFIVVPLINEYKDDQEDKLLQIRKFYFTYFISHSSKRHFSWKI